MGRWEKDICSILPARKVSDNFPSKDVVDSFPGVVQKTLCQGRNFGQTKKKNKNQRNTGRLATVLEQQEKAT